MNEYDDCGVDYAENYMEQDDFSDNESESIDMKVSILYLMRILITLI